MIHRKALLIRQVSFLVAECRLPLPKTRIHPLILCRSFFQGLCVLGYCVAPLNIAALISCFVRVIWVRAPVALLAWAWCIWGMLLHSITHPSPSDVMASICQFPRRNQNRTAADSARCISPTVNAIRFLSASPPDVDKLASGCFILYWRG